MTYVIEYNDDRREFDNADEYRTLKQLLDAKGRDYRAYEQ